MKTLNEKLISLYRYGSDLDKIEECLKAGATPSYDDDAIFTMAASSGEYELLELLIQYDKENRIIENKQIISLAVLRNNTDCVKLLLKNGVKVEDFTNTIYYEKIKEINVELKEEPQLTNLFDDLRGETHKFEFRHELHDTNFDYQDEVQLNGDHNLTTDIH